MSDTCDPVGARLLCPWGSPGKNTGVGCHSLLQGIFPTQESNPGLLHYKQILYQLSYQGSCFHFFPFYVLQSDWTGCYDLNFFLMLSFKTAFPLSSIYVFIYFSILYLFMLSLVKSTMPKREETFRYLWTLLKSAFS